MYWISEKKKKKEEEGRAKKSLDGEKIGAFITRGGSLFPDARRAPRAVSGGWVLGNYLY